jgi:hypothetical protein
MMHSIILYKASSIKRLSRCCSAKTFAQGCNDRLSARAGASRADLPDVEIVGVSDVAAKWILTDEYKFGAKGGLKPKVIQVSIEPCGAAA